MSCLPVLLRAHLVQRWELLNQLIELLVCSHNQPIAANQSSQQLHSGVGKYAPKWCLLREAGFDFIQKHIAKCVVRLWNRLHDGQVKHISLFLLRWPNLISGLC